MRTLYVVGLMFLLTACSKKNEIPPNIIPPEKMQRVLWDIIRADAYTQEYIKKDETKNPLLENAALQKRVFSFYKITKEDFTRSFNYYTEKPELINALLDSMIARQTKDREDYRKRLQ